MIYHPDDESKIRCRHRSGDPDCACFPECVECGDEFDPREGHICGDDVEKAPQEPEEDS